MYPIRSERPSATYALLLANVIIFFLSLILGQGWMIRAFGIAPSDLIDRGLFFKLFTSMFLHADFLHIFFNMYALYIFGRDVELVAGTKRFLIIYFLSGVVGGILYSYYGYYFSPTQPISKFIPAVGASGAIFGVMAAFAVLFPNRPLAVFFMFFPLVARAYVVVAAIAIIQTALALLMPFSSIAYTAHIGGFIAGLLLTRLYKRRLIGFVYRRYDYYLV